MISWTPLRGHCLSSAFEAKINALGIDWPTFDRNWVEVETALCGVSLDELDDVYPIQPGSSGLRVFLTDETWGVPALRVIFRLENDGLIEFIDCDRR